MPTSGVLECNQNFKYPKKLPAALNSSILAENGAGSTNNSYFIMPTGCVLHWNQNIESAKNCLRRQRKREKGKKKRREETVYKISESEPSEREARETCERMKRKMASSQKVPAPALNHRCYITRLFFLANHSSLESQVELTGMLSSREQNPFPIPPKTK